MRDPSVPLRRGRGQRQTPGKGEWRPTDQPTDRPADRPTARPLHQLWPARSVEHGSCQNRRAGHPYPCRPSRAGWIGGRPSGIALSIPRVGRSSGEASDEFDRASASSLRAVNPDDHLGRSGGPSARQRQNRIYLLQAFPQTPRMRPRRFAIVYVPSRIPIMNF